MKGTYSGVRRLIPLRRLLESMGFPCQQPTPVYVDNAAVSAIIDAKRMTPRCRHLDIPICYLHEQSGVSYQHQLISTVQMLQTWAQNPWLQHCTADLSIGQLDIIFYLLKVVIITTFSSCSFMKNVLLISCVPFRPERIIVWYYQLFSYLVRRGELVMSSKSCLV
jgi:hypothetical protein